MKYEEYERPELVEIEIQIEGSFLNNTTSVDKDDDPWEGDFED